MRDKYEDEQTDDNCVKHPFEHVTNKIQVTPRASPLTTASERGRCASLVRARRSAQDQTIQPVNEKLTLASELLVLALLTSSELPRSAINSLPELLQDERGVLFQLLKSSEFRTFERRCNEDLQASSLLLSFR